MSVISKIRPYCLSFGTGFYIGKSTCYEKSLLFKLQESFPNERKQRLASLLFIAPNKNPHIHSLCKISRSVIVICHDLSRADSGLYQ